MSYVISLDHSDFITFNAQVSEIFKATGFNLYQNVANNLSLRVFSNKAELRPGKSVVHVVLHLIVFWQAKQVAMLHVHQVRCLKIGRNIICFGRSMLTQT